MDTYDIMRRFADSWALLAMVLFFLGVVIRSITAKGGDIAAAAAIPLDERGPKDFEREAAAHRADAGDSSKEAKR